MNLSHNALRDLTTLTELKPVGGILERHFVGSPYLQHGVANRGSPLRTTQGTCNEGPPC